MITIQEIYQEISNLNIFDKATHSERMCKVAEEFGELAQSVNKTIGRKINKLSEEEKKAEIIEEGADLIQTTISLLYGYGITAEELIAALVEKNKKWAVVTMKRALDKGK